MTRREVSRRPAAGGLAPWQLELASRLLVRDVSMEVAAGEIANLCGLSRSYFAKAFKVSMGTPPHRWVLNQRLWRAAEMLEGTDERISAIASDCGFADQSHLTRQFHARVGLSPAAWRRQRKAGVAPPMTRAGAVP